MILLIDGYNLLKQIFSRSSGDLDRCRQQLIKELSFYKHKKNDRISEIIVVFDGGLFRHATREVKGGIVIIFSGQKQSADDWIFTHVQKNRGREFLLVSMDMELKSNVKKFGVDSIDVFKFYAILQDCLQSDVEKLFEIKNCVSDLKKHIHDKTSVFDEFEQRRSSDALDLLMDEASLIYTNFEKIDDYDDGFSKKKGESKRMSKKERRYRLKIKKL